VLVSVEPDAVAGIQNSRGRLEDTHPNVGYDVHRSESNFKLNGTLHTIAPDASRQRVPLLVVD
jgi:hypothetical protein